MEDRLLRKDGPWSIVVCAVTFMSQAIGGGVQTSGLYYAYFQSAFDTSGVATSWLCSMSFVGWFLGTSIGGPIIKRFGCRVCAFGGAIVSSAGFALCMMSHNFYTLFILYGLLGCVGNGVQICGFYTAVNGYFDKYINSAQNFASVGVGIGISVYSIIYTGFIEHYGWRGALLLQAGFSLNACVLATLLFPRTTPTKRHARKTIRYSVILQFHVLLLCLHFFFAVITESMFYVHLPILITSKGFSLESASLSLLVVGVSNIVSRLIYSIPCNINVILLYTVTVVSGGVLILVLPHLHTLTSILVCLAAIGFTFNVYGGINLLVIRETAETDEFVDVAAIAFLFKSVGAVSSGPIAGIVYDITRDYRYEFYVSGTISVVSCLFLLPAILLKTKWRNRQDNIEIAITISGKPGEESVTLNHKSLDEKS